MTKPLLAENKPLPSHFRILVLLFLGLLTQLASILHRPNPQISDSTNTFCNYYITKLQIFHVHLDCDAQYFLLDSQNPMRILNSQTPLQDRPLHTFTVFVISKILEIAGIPVGPVVYLGDDGIPQTYNLINYGVFIVINALLLLISVLLVLKAISSNIVSSTKHFAVTAVIALVLVVQNPITREFFWTPHSQIFNILIPCLLFYMVQQEFVVTKKNYLFLLVGIAVGLFIYPSFYIILPIFLIKTFRSLGKIRTFLIPLSLAPKLLFPVLLNALGRKYVDWPLTVHRRIMWIKDAYESKTLSIEVSRNWSSFLHSLPEAWTLIFLVLLIIGVYGLVSLNASKTTMPIQQVRDSALMLFIYFAGIIVNGAYGARFTSGLIILFGLITLKIAATVIKVVKFWWIPYLAIFSLNLFYWVL